MFLFLLFLSVHSWSSFFPVPLFHLLLSLLSLFFLSLEDDSKWHKRVDVSFNPNTVSRGNGTWFTLYVRLYLLKLKKKYYLLIFKIWPFYNSARNEAIIYGYHCRWNFVTSEINRAITDVQLRQENMNSKVQCSSGKWGLPSFCMEHWSQWLAFSCHHWKSVIGSFSHMPSRKQCSFSHFSLENARKKCRKIKIITKPTNLFSKMFLGFQLRQWMLTLDVFVHK